MRLQLFGLLMVLQLCSATSISVLGQAAVLEPEAKTKIAPETQAPAAIGKSYEQWVAACRKLPTNRELRGRAPSKEILPLRDFAEFDLVLSAFLELNRTSVLSSANNWLGTMPSSGFFDTTQSYFQKSLTGSGGVRFQPFAQKLVVPEGSEVFFHGDFHGDVHSLIRLLQWLNDEDYLDGFRIVRPDFHLVLLGDYTDRGLFGVEVLYTLFQLKLANPERVFFARGNHEDISLLARYGFFHEGRAKYGSTFNVGKIARAYDFLPVVIYLQSGENVIQCNHGGMEPGYNPKALLAAPDSKRFQLLGKLGQRDFALRHPQWLAEGEGSNRDLALRALRDYEPEEPTSPTVLGFMWNDFSVLASEPQFAVDPDRAFVYGQRATEFILQKASTTNRVVQAVFRAHQHSSVLNPMMRRLVACNGLFRHWQELDSVALLNAAPQQLAARLEKGESRAIPARSVWTFNVSPDSAYGEGCGFAFDAFGILTTARAFSDWRVRAVRVEPK